MKMENKKPLSKNAQIILKSFDDSTKLGDLRKIAKEIKKDHLLAMELWSTALFKPRQLAILIMDNKKLDEAKVNSLGEDMAIHDENEQTQLMDWLFANQLTKSKKLVQLIESWCESKLPLQRRTYWYYEGRRRWMGKTPPENSGELLSIIEQTIMDEEAVVQWAMNFVAGWIGVYEDQYRARCVQLGEETELYKGMKVSKGCTPNYLPEFIEIEYNKRLAKEPK